MLFRISEICFFIGSLKGTSRRELAMEEREGTTGKGGPGLTEEDEIKL